jgi:hypothetical protein
MVRTLSGLLSIRSASALLGQDYPDCGLHIFTDAWFTVGVSWCQLFFNNQFGLNRGPAQRQVPPDNDLKRPFWLLPAT